MNDEFISLSLRLQKMLAKEEFYFTTFESKALPYFSNLTSAQQIQIVNQLKTLIELGEELQQQGKKLSNSADLIQTFFRKFKLYTPSWVIDSITNKDIVDVYNLESRLIVASLNLFEICSYSMEELFCRPWAELFAREGETHVQIYQLCRALLNGEISEPVDMTNIPQHKVRETYFPEGSYALLQPRIFSPVYADDKIYGFLSINRIVELKMNKHLKDHK